MPNQAEGNGRTGRNVALPDENRPSWRPQDETAHRNRRALSEEDDRFEDERYPRGHWEDRERRDWDRERGDWRGERYGIGSTGYYSRRYGEDQRDASYPGSFEERYRERTDYGRGYTSERDRERGLGYGERYGSERYGGPRGYGERGYGEERQNLGTGGVRGYGQREPWSGREEVPSGHRGKGPAGYQRSDERVREIICEALTDDDRIDATNIEVTVKSGEVTLTGTVDDRQMKRFAEDLVEGISGVRDVQNQIRVSGDKRRGGDSDRTRHRG